MGLVQDMKESFMGRSARIASRGCLIAFAISAAAADAAVLPTSCGIGLPRHLSGEGCWEESGRTASTDGGVALASELLDEKNWLAARCESQRVLLREPTNEVACLVGLAAEARLGRDLPGVLRQMQGLADHAAAPQVRAMAAYEAGRLLIVSGESIRAYEWIKQAYLHAPDRALFMKSGCTLTMLFQKHPELGRGNAMLRREVMAGEPLWDARLREECSLSRPGQRVGLFSLPGRAIVAFYRSCVSPAIGARCSLTPSCSQYFLEASRKHGLLAFPIVADRLVREPGVVAAARRPVFVGGKRRIADPLEDHDAWLSEFPRKGRAQ